MMEIVRNMSRRKVRTSLTVFGIVIGVFALTVMGALSEYFNTLLDNAVKIAGTNIGVQPGDRSVEARLSETTIRLLRRVKGVQEVLPSVTDTLDQMGMVNMGMPDLVYGVVPEHSSLEFPGIGLAKGRWLQRGDEYQAVVGQKVATKLGLDLGHTITWREKQFTVVGILDITNTAPDQFVQIPIDIARRELRSPNAIGGLSVVPEDPSRVDELAERINREVPHVQAKPPRQAIDEIRQGLLIFNVIMLSSAALAAIVGGLSVINTMIMSVNERTREIGIKKAVGASDMDIIKEYLLESALIGLLGGLIGLYVGWQMTLVLNHLAAPSLGGSELWLVTPRLALFVLIFATGLGAVAGLYPAWNASRLDPVQALRNE